MQTATRVAILNHLLRSISYSKPTYYLGWSTYAGDSPPEINSVDIVEISGSGYSRQLLVTNDASWTYNDTNRIIDNAIILTSITFQEEWLSLGNGVIKYLDIYSAATNGDLLWRIPCVFAYGTDGTSITFQIGDFNIGLFVIV